MTTSSAARTIYAADRAAAGAVLKIYPELAFTARANRAFLGRAVRYLAISHVGSDLLNPETRQGLEASRTG